MRLDKNLLFEPRGSSSNAGLASKSARGGAIVIATQIGQYFLQVAAIVVLARILTPHDYGIIAMVAVVVNFATMFKDAGLALATVQNPEIKHTQISTLFWVNLAISAVLCVCIIACAPLVASFYGKPELTRITIWLSFSFILGGLSIQHQALLQRHMQFGSLAVIQVTAQLGSFIITLLMALYGWSYWALVGGALSHALFTSLGSFWFCPWKPGLPSRNTGIRSMLMFGGHMTGFNMVNYFARNTDNILVGRYIGPEALGIYGKAYQILMLPIGMMSGPLSNVAVPALSQLSDDRPRLRKYYLHILYMLALLASPIPCLAFLSGSEIVWIFLGPNWGDVSGVFRLLAIGGLLQPLYNTQAWPHVAVGRADRVFTWSLIGTPVIVASFVIGLPWGVEGVALGYSLAIIVTTLGALAYAGYSIDLSLSSILAEIVRPLTACVLSVLAVDVLFGLISIEWPPLISLAVKTAGFLMVYTVSLLLLYGGQKAWRDITAIGAFIKPKPSA